MAGQVFVYIAHKDGLADDTALELVTAAKKINPDAPATAIVAGSGDGVDAVCNEMAASYQEVWKVDNEALSYPNAEVIRKLLVNILPSDTIIVLQHDTFGMDLAPGLSIKMDDACVTDSIGFEGIDENNLKAVRQEYAGMVSTNVSCDISAGAVITCRPGAFQPNESKSAAGTVVDKSSEIGDLSVKRRFVEVIEAESGDVDITKSEVLIGVGRGIEEEENLEIVEELSEAIGADIGCTRPIVDAKWMETSRQIGTSALTVKPKVYIALGISGAFQHIGGVKGSPFFVAINKNPKASIFQVADVGIVADILEFVPELTEKIKEAG
jgi:electron transfer flavoprotein alpha subunit